MRPLSYQLLLSLPAVLAVLMLTLVAMPLQLGNFPLTPNVAWVMSLVVATLYPPAWPRGFAFLLGLAQDVIFGTPLGSQALLTVLLVTLVRMQARRQHYQLFRIRWLEATGVLVLWHGLLWLLLDFAEPHTPPLRPLLITGFVSAAWYPVFYGIVMKIGAALPVIKQTR